jgi:hypothetical protein
MNIGKWLVWIGSGLLFAAACMHMVGYPSTLPLLAGVQPIGLAAFKTLTLSFGFTLMLLAVVIAMLSRVARAKKILVVAALIPLVDVVLMFHFLGLFIGTIGVLAATVPLVVGALMFSDEQKQR